MASNSRGVSIAIQLVLVAIIVGLAYFLYVSLTAPYEKIRRQEEITDRTRSRMGDIRTALIRYERINGRFTADLDSLQMFVTSDSLFRVEGDSLFSSSFLLDSLAFSPRTGNRFELSVNDTSRVQTYLLKDPDTRDQIGTPFPDVTLLNASSWE